MLIYDSHCHYAAISANPLTFPIAVAAISLADMPQLQAYRQINPLAKIGCGIHPWLIAHNYATFNHALASSLKAELYALIEKSQPSFIGETGLDKLKPNFALQLQAFKLHLELARDFKLPIIIHCVHAYNELLQLLRAYPKLRGSIHAFNGNQQLADQLAQKNMYLGIGSIILKNTSQLQRAQIPSTQLLFESDAPYMPACNKIASSPYDCLIYAQRLAQLQQKSLTSIITAANQNWCSLFAS